MSIARFTKLIPLLAFMILVAGCGDDAPTTQNQPEDNAALAGRVVDSSNPDAPLGGAVVSIEGTDMTTVTDENGEFSFDGIAPGEVEIVVEVPGDDGFEPTTIEVTVHGDETVDLDVTVLPSEFAPEEIRIFPETVRSGLRESVHFRLYGRFDHDLSVRPTWSLVSDSPIGVVSRDGIFIGTSVGRGEIVATLSNDLVASASIEVVANDDISAIVVGPRGPLTIQAGQERWVGAYARNGSGHFVDGELIEWSIDPSDELSVVPEPNVAGEEKMRIARMLYLTRDYGTGNAAGTDRVVPLEAISLARLVSDAGLAEDAVADLVISAGDFSVTTITTVISRGRLAEISIGPGVIEVPFGHEAWVFAEGRNEHGRPMSGLEFSWRVDPIDLGDLEKFEIEWGDEDVRPDHPGDGGFPDGGGGDVSDPSDDSPDWRPGDGWGGDRPDGTAGGNAGSSGSSGSGGSTGGGHEPTITDEPVPPLPAFGEGQIFTPRQVGEGRIFLEVYDPISGVTLEAEARVLVADRVGLERVIIEPERLVLHPGDEAMIIASAIGATGDLIWDADFKVEISGEIGELLEHPDIGLHGMAERLWSFIAGNAPANGAIRVTAVDAAGNQAAAEAEVSIVGQP